MAISFVQGASITDGVSPYEVSFLDATTSGNLLVVAVTWQNAPDTNCTAVSDAGGNTWTALTERQNVGTTSCWARLFYTLNEADGAHTIEASFDVDPGAAQMWCVEFTGNASTGMVNTENGAEADTVTSLNAGSLTTTLNNTVLVGVVRTLGDRTFTAPTDWTAVGTATARSLMAYRVVSSTGTYPATFTWTASSSSAVGATAAFVASEASHTLGPDARSATVTGTTSPLGFTIRMPGQFQ